MAEPYVLARLERARADVERDAPRMRGLAEAIAPGHFSGQLRAVRLLQAVQAMTRYELTADVEGRAPLATWAAGVGDCADAAPLLAALCIASGLPARLVYMPGRSIDHLTVQVETSPGRWAWAEPTLRGARLGEHPHQAARRLGVGRADLGGKAPALGAVFEGESGVVVVFGAGFVSGLVLAGLVAGLVLRGRK